MNQAYPELADTQDSKEGSASHNIGADIILHAARAFERFEADYVNKVDANGIVYTAEMFDGAEMYADNVIEVVRGHKIFGSKNFGVEQQIAIPRIHANCFGTPDAFLLTNDGVLYIWDYKFGRVWVDEFENWQLMAYFAGLIDYFGWSEADLEHITVKMRVVQPRAYGRGGSIREWSTKASNLRGHINILRQNAAKALSDQTEFKSGPHCHYCPGRHACQAAVRGGWRLFEAATGPLPDELNAQQLGTQLSLVQRAKAQLASLETGYKEQVRHLATNGVNVPGYALQSTESRLNWDKPLEEVHRLGDVYNVELRKLDAPTPKQAIKLGVDAAIISGYCSTPTTGVKIVKDDNSKMKRLFT